MHCTTLARYTRARSHPRGKLSARISSATRARSWPVHRATFFPARLVYTYIYTHSAPSSVSRLFAHSRQLASRYITHRENTAVGASRLGGWTTASRQESRSRELDFCLKVSVGGDFYRESFRGEGGYNRAPVERERRRDEGRVGGQGRGETGADSRHDPRGARARLLHFHFSLALQARAARLYSFIIRTFARWWE